MSYEPLDDLTFERASFEVDRSLGATTIDVWPGRRLFARPLLLLRILWTAACVWLFAESGWDGVYLSASSLAVWPTIAAGAAKRRLKLLPASLGIELRIMAWSWSRQVIPFETIDRVERTGRLWTRLRVVRIDGSTTSLSVGNAKDTAALASWLNKRAAAASNASTVNEVIEAKRAAEAFMTSSQAAQAAFGREAGRESTDGSNADAFV